MSNVNYSFTQDGVVYDFDDIFVPAESFRGPSLWRSGFGIGSTLTQEGTGVNWRSTSAGFGNAAGIKLDGTLWVWGGRGDGQIGDNNTFGSQTTPTTTLLGGTNWKYVSLGTYHCTAIKTDGTLWTWGRNTSGQLGVNDIISRSTPVTTILGGNDWKYSDAGFINSSALKTDGTLWSWGAALGISGTLGLNDNILRSTPTQVFGNATNWKSYSHGATGNGMVAIKYDGTLWVWGVNDRGQLGINDTTYRSTPVTTILGGTNWKSVACGDAVVAIKTDGTLWTWGSNSYGQLGINERIGSQGFRGTPVTTLLGGTNWKAVASAYSVVMAVKTDGSLWTWGQNDYGQLGVGDTNIRSTPVTTSLGKNEWKGIGIGGISVGSNSIAAILYEPDP